MSAVLCGPGSFGGAALPIAVTQVGTYLRSELRSQPTRLPRVEGVINAPSSCSVWEREVVVVRLSGTRGATVPTRSGPRPPPLAQRRRCRCAEADLAIPSAQLAVIDDEGHKGQPGDA